MKVNRLYISFTFYTIAFALLTIMAAFLYEERLFGESGMDVLCVVNRESFCILWGRYSMFFGQLLPVICLKLHLPLKAVLISFSIAPFLIYYLLFSVSHLWFKDELAGLGFLILLTINVNSAYYLFPMADIQYGSAILIVIHSFINNRRYSNSRMLLLGILTFFAIYSHLLVVFVLIALICFNLLGGKDKPDLKWMKGLIFWSVIFAIAKYILFPNPYDVSKMDSQFQLFSLTSGFNLRHLASFWSINQITVILLGMVMIYFIVTKKFLKLAVYTIGFIGLYFLLYATVPEGESSEYHLAYGASLTSVLLFPLVYDMAGLASAKWVRWRVIIIILAACFLDTGRINNLAKTFTNEITMMRDIISYARSRGIQRGILKDESLCNDCLIPYYHQHSLLVSGQEGPAATVQLELESHILRDYLNDSLYEALDMKQDSLLAYFVAQVTPGIGKTNDINDAYDIYQYELNKNYFDIPNPTYYVLARNNRNEFDLVKNNFQLKFENKEMHLADQGRPFTFALRIDNSVPEQVLYAGAVNGAMIEFTWSDRIRNRVIEKVYHPLFADIHESYYQHVSIDAPSASYKCILTAELTLDGRPLGQGDSILVNF